MLKCGFILCCKSLHCFISDRFSFAHILLCKSIYRKLLEIPEFLNKYFPSTRKQAFTFMDDGELCKATIERKDSFVTLYTYIGNSLGHTIFCYDPMTKTTRGKNFNNEK